MKEEHDESPSSSPTAKKSTLSDGLLILPNNVRCFVQNSNSVTEHRRTGSTGTTGDESYTTDDEEETEEPDFPIKKTHITRNLFTNQNPGCFSDISTITDKVRHLNLTHRNSSDSSVYSEKYADEVETDINFNSFLRLKNDLKEANQELKLRDEELSRLSRIRQDVESELEDLTASLFQEAHNMVREANEKQANAEKALKESQMKVDVLTAEVSALKTLVLTSTPSSPNPHLHPQIGNNGKDEAGGVLFAKKHHRRSPSHFNLKYGRENSPPDSPVKEKIVHISSEVEAKDGLEVDPVIHKEFLSWREKPCLEKSEPFIQRIYEEDINLCLNFNNKELTERILQAVETGTILIEAIGDKNKAMFPKKCALLQVPRLCFYRMNIGETNVDNWYNISQICRNRIIAVCDFLNYLKYIEGGLVKSSAHDVYWEIVRLRKNMCLARLGLVFS